MANERLTGKGAPADVTKHLQGLDFPASRADLVRQAEKNGADRDAMEIVRKMPEREYGDMSDVMKAYGEVD
jgi:hypothetical protein